MSRYVLPLLALALLTFAAYARGAETGTLLVLNKSDATVSLLDLASRKAVATIATGAGPHSRGGRVARRPDGRCHELRRSGAGLATRSAADFDRGAVPYTASEYTRADEEGAGVTVHALIGRNEGREAAAVAGVVEQSLAEIMALESAERGRDGTPEPRYVVVLVRSRASLPPLLAELRRRGIDYRGVELESLRSRAAVRDLLALARALLHPGDRTAWLAVLRAPWCGLTLADLHALASGERRATLLSLLEDPVVMGSLSPDGRQRAARVMGPLQAALADQGRRSLGSWLRSSWIALDGAVASGTCPPPT